MLPGCYEVRCYAVRLLLLLLWCIVWRVLFGRGPPPLVCAWLLLNSCDLAVRCGAVRCAAYSACTLTLRSTSPYCAHVQRLQ